MRRPLTARLGHDDGQTTVLTVGLCAVLVALMLVMLAVTTVQLQHRRLQSLADRNPEDGVQRARELLSTGVPGQSGADVAAELTSQDGVPVLRVTVSSSLPGLGFLPGPIPVEVSGHAFRQ